jgi:hypothetical protein
MFLAVIFFVLIAWWRMDRFFSRETDAKPSGGGSEPPEQLEDPSKRPRPGLAIATLSAAYVTFAAWTFVAWYRAHKPLSQYRWGGDGWMGKLTYAGGADKCGHAWATMALARLGTYVLTAVGGFNRLKSSIVSALLSELAFTGVEVRDGFFYEFSFSDLTGDSVGMLLALLFDNFPRLRELCAYRVEYFPSRSYARKIAGTSPCPGGSCSRWNIAEDYSGQTYLAALHLGGIKAIRNKLGNAARFVDVAIEFDSRNYRPTPDMDIAKPIRQDLFLGLSINAQGIFDTIFEGRPSKAAQRAKTITHGLFEVFNLPLGSVRMVGTSREGPVRPLRLPASTPALPAGSKP